MFKYFFFDIKHFQTPHPENHFENKTATIIIYVNTAEGSPRNKTATIIIYVITAEGSPRNKKRIKKTYFYPLLIFIFSDSDEIKYMYNVQVRIHDCQL